MLHHMLQYSETSTDLIYVDIATTPLEFRQSFNIEMIEKRNAQNGSTVEDGATIGNVCNNIRLSIDIPEWRKFTDSQLLILKKKDTLKCPRTNKISEFSARPSPRVTLTDNRND